MGPGSISLMDTHWWGWMILEHPFFLVASLVFLRWIVAKHNQARSNFAYYLPKLFTLQVMVAFLKAAFIFQLSRLQNSEVSSFKMSTFYPLPWADCSHTAMYPIFWSKKRADTISDHQRFV